jgi:hypothetical protein
MKLNMTPVSADIFAKVGAFIENNPGAIRKDLLATIDIARPGTPYVTPGGVAYGQSDFIGGQIAPEIVAGANEEAAFRRWGKDAFVVRDLKVAMNGNVKPVDSAWEFKRIELDVHGAKVALDPRMVRASAGLGINLVDEMFPIPQEAVDLEKEYLQAQFFQTVGSYASSAQYGDLPDGDLWSALDSVNPITEILSKAEEMRTRTGKRPNWFWMSPAAGILLAQNKFILDLTRYGGDPGVKGGLAWLQVIAALIRMNVVQGDAIAKLSEGPTGTTVDVWDVAGTGGAGFCFVGGPTTKDPKFAATLVSRDFPKTIPYFDEDAAAEGANGVKYLDAYRVVAQMPESAYWWRTTK